MSHLSTQPLISVSTPVIGLPFVRVQSSHLERELRSSGPCLPGSFQAGGPSVSAEVHLQL